MEGEVSFLKQAMTEVKDDVKIMKADLEEIKKALIVNKASVSLGTKVIIGVGTVVAFFTSTGIDVFKTFFR